VAVPVQVLAPPHRQTPFAVAGRAVVGGAAAVVVPAAAAEAF